MEPNRNSMCNSFFNARQFYVVCLRDTAFLSGAPFLFHCYCCWWWCCCFLAINQILFTMCSNRKMFPNKFMVCTLYLCVFFRFAPSFPSIHVVFVNRFTCRHLSSSCIRFHVPTFDNKNLKRFHKRVPMAVANVRDSYFNIMAVSDDLLFHSGSSF